MTLDYIEKIEIDEKNPPLNNLQVIGYSHIGLSYLYKEMKKLEDAFEQSPYKGATFMSGSSTNTLHPSLFHWFAISAVSYVRTIKLLDLMVRNNWLTNELISNKKLIKQSCEDYIGRVIPDVYTWRNKIGAHFAATDPRSDDNIALLEYSLMAPVSYIQNHFYVGVLSWNTQGESAKIPQWSLVETFENILTPRYWPSM